MFKLWKFIKGVYDVQFHLLPVSFRKVVFTPLIMFAGKYASGIELMTFDRASKELDTYCLFGLVLYRSDSPLSVEIRLLWLFRFSIVFQIQD